MGTMVEAGGSGFSRSEFAADSAKSALTLFVNEDAQQDFLQRTVYNAVFAEHNDGVVPEHIWDQAQGDAELLESDFPNSDLPLWPIDPTDTFNKYHREMRATWSSEPRFAFWQRWWDGVVSGRQIDWRLQDRVALIPNEIWEQGAESVAAEIARIELDFAVEASPNAEDIVINAEGKYEAVPRSTLPARTLRDARDRIGDTIRLIRGEEVQNQHAALVPEAELLQDVLDRYGDNALRLHEACYKVVRHLGVHVASGVLPEGDNVVADVASDLQNTADDIYNFDEEVRRTVEARAKLRFERLGEREKAQVEELALAVADRSVPALAEELREDAASVRSEGEPTEETAASRYRLVSRLARVAKLGGKMFVDVTEALRWLSGVAGGTGVITALFLLLLSLL